MAMEMDHSFTVPVPPDRAWDVLLDVERIAPCMPGASVDEFDGEVVTGRIKVKVGPVSLTYRGTAKFTERDPDAKVIVLEASGKETRGAGTASATVRATLEPESGGEATKATMHTTMNVTGRQAQFGRGVMVEVGGKLVEQFAQNLRQLITDDSAGGGGAAAAEAGAAEASAATDGSASADQATTATQDGPGQHPAVARRPVRGTLRRDHDGAVGAARSGQRRLHQPGQAGGARAAQAGRPGGRCRGRARPARPAPVPPGRQGLARR